MRACRARIWSTVGGAPLPPNCFTKPSMVGNVTLSSRLSRPKSSCTLFWTGVPADTHGVLIRAARHAQLAQQPSNAFQHLRLIADYQQTLLALSDIMGRILSLGFEGEPRNELNTKCCLLGETPTLPSNLIDLFTTTGRSTL